MKVTQSNNLPDTITFQPENAAEIFQLGRLYQCTANPMWGYSVEMKLQVTVSLSSLVSRAVGDNSKTENE